MLPGASAISQRPYIYRWNSESGTPNVIFQATHISWAGVSEMEMHPGPGGSKEIVLTGPAFGVFDHKLLPHPTRTQVWQWSGYAGRFVIVEESVSEPTTRRQQVNVAEALLRAGEYETAAVEYWKAIEDESLEEEDSGAPEVHR